MSEADDDGEADDAAGVRLDKWLWRARFFKTRTLAAKAVSEGVRVDGRRLEKPSATVRPGNVLTFPQGDRIRVIEILALGERRGPAAEAQALYRDRSGPAPSRSEAAAPAPAPEGGRPTKKDRRALDRVRRADP